MRGVYRERRVQCGLHQGRDHEPGGVVLRHCNVRGRADGDRLASDADVRRGIARPLLFGRVAGLWTFRAVGVHYQLRYQAFTARNDWVEVLRPDKHDEWPDNADELTLTQRIRAEAIGRRTTSPSFMPRWTDRYWVE